MKQTIVGSYSCHYAGLTPSFAQDKAARIFHEEKEGLLNNRVKELTGVDLIDEHHRNGTNQKTRSIALRLEKQGPPDTMGPELWLLDGKAFLQFERIESAVSVIDGVTTYSLIQNFEVLPWE